MGLTGFDYLLVDYIIQHREITVQTKVNLIIGTMTSLGIISLVSGAAIFILILIEYLI
jgi:uncharacterized iron-regulated membrane protein